MKRLVSVCCAVFVALSLAACGGREEAAAAFVPAAGVETDTLLPEQFEAARLALEKRCGALGLQAEVVFDTEQLRYSVYLETAPSAEQRESLALLGRTADFSVTEDDTGGTVLLDASDLAAVALLETGAGYQLKLTLTDAARERWAEATRRLKGKEVSIWLDHKLFSRPQITAEMTDGTSVLGPFRTREEAAGMAAALAAPLPFRIEAILT